MICREGDKKDFGHNNWSNWIGFLVVQAIFVGIKGKRWKGVELLNWFLFKFQCLRKEDENVYLEEEFIKGIFHRDFFNDSFGN